MKTSAGKLVLVPAAALLAITASCHQLTEYEGTMTADVIFINSADFSVVGSIGGIEDGRVLCSINSTTFYVLSGSGVLYKLNSETMSMDTSFSVFSGTGSGFYDILAPPPRSKVYILGNGSQLVEVGVTSNLVTDVFQVGPSPCCMTEGNGNLYVGDAQDNRFREVDVTYNIVTRWTQLPFSPQALEVGNNGEFCLVTSRADGANGLVRLLTSSMHYNDNASDFISSGNDVQALADTSSWFTACPNWSMGFGRVFVSDSLGDFIENTYLQGHPFSLAGSPDGHYLYVLRKTLDGRGELMVIDEWFGGIVTDIPIDGYPWDVTVHRNGELILVLVGQ